MSVCDKVQLGKPENTQSDCLSVCYM